MPKSKNAKGRNPRPRQSGQADAEMGKRIRLRRVEKKMSQAELGAKLGVSFQQIQKYEKGVNRVVAHRLQQIARTLDVPVGFFFNGENGATPREEGGRREVESLLFLDSNFSLRLLRAYTAVGNIEVQRKFVSLMESIAGTVAAE